MSAGSTPAPDDDLLGPILESFVGRFRRGERPSLTELMARHPELAGQIRELVPALVDLEQLAGSPRGPGGSAKHTAASAITRDEGPSPERLGDYRILRRIGGGGMGVVYEAEHVALRRSVALKVMLPRLRDDPRYLRRFQSEASLAAGLHHTNIVGIFDYGEQDGVCYYAMQLIEGQPLDRVLSDIRLLREGSQQGDPESGSSGLGITPAAGSAAARGLLTGRFAVAMTADAVADATLPIGVSDPEGTGSFEMGAEAMEPADLPSDRPSSLGSSTLGPSGELRYYREIARIGAQVADALEYAHHRRIVHRDIKPSNLLLDAQGNVWVTDFGLSRFGDGADLTQSRELLGTLRYMAPERLRGKSDRRSDVYSLGATLYEMVALRPPFEEADEIRLMERIRNDAPPSPRQLDRKLPRDLETILQKALAKDPKDRFSSAGALAEELRRFIDGRPIRSRPVSVPEQFWRWCKRDPWLAGASIAAVAVTFLLALGSMAAAIVYRNQAEALRVERNRSDGASLDASRRAVDAYTAQARAGRFSRRPGQRFETLDAVKQAVKLLDSLPPAPDTASRRDELRDLAIAALALPDLRPTGQVIARPSRVICTAFDSTMSRYALRFRNGTISVRRVADDREIAPFRARGDRDVGIYFSPDGRYLAATHFPGGAQTVWDVDRRVVAVGDPDPIPLAARFSPDSRSIAVALRGELAVYDLTTGRPSRRWPGSYSGLAFRPDGTQIAVIDDQSKPPSCRILDAESGRQVRAFPLRVLVGDVAWNPDGTMLATTTRISESKIDLWDVATGTRRATLLGLGNLGLRTSFHPAGTLLASNGFESRLRLWDPIMGRPLLDVTSGSGPDFSADGRIDVSNEDKLIIHEVDPAREYRSFVYPLVKPTHFDGLTVRNDGRLLAVGTDAGVLLWDLARGTELAYMPIQVAWHLMFEESGDLITSGPLGVNRWPIQVDARRGEVRIGPPRLLPVPGLNCGIAEDSSGRIVAKADHGFAYVATPEGTRRLSSLNDCRSVAVSPDGQWLATGTHVASHGAQVWRISDLTKVADLPIDYGTVVLFSPDGKWLLTTASPCRLWEVGTWREVRRIGDVAGCFSPDGRLLVVQQGNKLIRLVETETGRTLARLESPDLCPVVPTFSPDGSRLVVSTNDGPAVHVWDLRAIRKQLAGMGLDWDAPAYSADDPTDPSAPPLTSVQVRYQGDGIAEGAALAREGRWDEAASAYARAFNEGVLDQAERWLEQAILRLAVGDAAGYRQSCQRMVDRFNILKRFQPAGLEDPAYVNNWHGYTAHTLALAPGEPRQAAQALQLATRWAQATHPASSEQVLGLALYRAGRFAEADTRLRSFLDRDPRRDDHVLDWLVLSMANQRLGRSEDARLWLERAERWVAVRLTGRPGGVDRAVPENWMWRDAILMHLLLREARALFGANQTMLPENVFAPAS
ncbi:MAG: protein kinase domain-containing protein [Isosphaeraceae bacterium]